MGSLIVNVKIFIHYMKYLPLIYLYKRSKNRNTIDCDIKRWTDETEICGRNLTATIVQLLLFRPQFRNLFFYRIKSNSSILKTLCKPDATLTIATDCKYITGGAIYFEHATGTHIAAKSIGAGCIFRHLTTLGVKSKNRHNERPTVGNNVDFGVNVTCIGDITIGDNAIIAAGSVVVKDVPPNAIVAGNPAKVIKYRTEDTIN